jgi:hypothetical protein
LSIIKDIIEEKQLLNQMNWFPDQLLISDILWKALQSEVDWPRVITCEEQGNTLEGLEVVVFEQGSNPFLGWVLSYKDKSLNTELKGGE